MRRNHYSKSARSWSRCSFRVSNPLQHRQKSAFSALLASARICYPTLINQSMTALSKYSKGDADQTPSQTMDTDLTFCCNVDTFKTERWDRTSVRGGNVRSEFAMRDEFRELVRGIRRNSLVHSTIDRCFTNSLSRATTAQVSTALCSFPIPRCSLGSDR